MRCAAKTSTGVRCKRKGKRCGLSPHPLCHVHRTVRTNGTCKTVVESNEWLCRCFRGHSTPGMLQHVPWERLPSIVWANVTKWLSCNARRIAQRTSKAFVFRYSFHQCSCLKRDGQAMRLISNARYAFWNHFFDCVLTYTQPPQLPDAWADDPHLRRITSHYATWTRRLRVAYDTWLRLIRSFRHWHRMYDGDIPHDALNTRTFPHDKFTVTEDADTVRIHHHQSQRFHTESGNLVPTMEFIMRLYDQLRDDWTSPCSPSSVVAACAPY